ncbi:hypothetical protein [Capnocytophaga cynodegmi]|uniref:hypothetical protein n=1 Tax=Capnocytophaga cynodegmi TaxID=28189 RepID=UPI002100102F|nr:hypothetical protein [Capnocytophaga cynodegmi]
MFKIINVPLYEIEELQILQEKLLAQHREFESEVNFYKQNFANSKINQKLIMKGNSCEFHKHDKKKSISW